MTKQNIDVSSCLIAWHKYIKNSGIVYQSVVWDLCNLHEILFFFQTIKVVSKHVHLYPTNYCFCLHSYLLTSYYVSYSCWYQYFLKYNIYIYCDIWPNQLRSHGSISTHTRLLADLACQIQLITIIICHLCVYHFVPDRVFNVHASFITLIYTFCIGHICPIWWAYLFLVHIL